MKLATDWGKPVVVENRDGATGVIGVNQVVRAAPDGYTLLLTVDQPLVIVPALSQTPYDPRSDLAPVAAVASSMPVLVVNPSLGVNSVRELVALSKARPGLLTFGSMGEASASRMCIELIRQEAGIDLVHIPYKGAPQAMQALLAGEVSMYCGPISQGLPHVKAGKLIALGVAGERPSHSLPGVPPLSAQGLPNVVISYWYGVFAPSGTPNRVLAKIRESLRLVFDDAEVRAKLASAGFDPLWLNEIELAARIHADLDRWARVVRSAGIKAE